MVNRLSTGTGTHNSTMLGMARYTNNRVAVRKRGRGTAVTKPNRRDWFRRIIIPVALAAIMTGQNALKAPCIDDPAYLAVARQIAVHPHDPYGFDQFWQN